MFAAPATPRSVIHATRVKGDTLRLSVDVSTPQSLVVRLICSEHTWSHEERLGLCQPGQEPLELRLKDWPEDNTYVLARFYEQGDRPAASASQWLSYRPAH